MVYCKINRFSRNYCSDIRTFQKAPFARKFGGFSPSGFCSWNDLDVREKVEIEKIAAHSVGTFWYVLPSLPMFLVMPLMLRKGISFPTSLGLGIALTGVLYFTMTKVLAKFGMHL